MLYCVSEEGRGDRSKTGGSTEKGERIVGIGRYQHEVTVAGGDRPERRMWNAGQRDNMNSFFMLAYLGPFYPEETAGSRELDIASSEVALTVKG